MRRYDRNPPQTPKLIHLVREVHEGTIALPDFQRSFVWKIRDVRELLISVFKGYFIGVFLTLKIDPENPPFGYRPVEGVDRVIRPTELVLDGQQRLTSLHYVLYSPDIPLRDTKYPYVFFLDLETLYNSRSIEEAIISKRKKEVEDILKDTELQFKERLLPLTALKSEGSWNRWSKEATKYAVRRNDAAFDRIIEYLDSDESPITTFLEFEVPVINLGRNVPIEQVVEIFERINTTGVRLSVFDLMTARLRPYGVMLRKLWIEARQYDYIRRLSNYPINIYILQTVALMKGKSPKRSGLLRLEPKDFEEWWRKAVHYVNKAVERMMNLRSGYGVINSKFLPHVTMIPPLASLLAKIENMRGTARHYEKLDIWYWRSVFTARYTGSPDSTMYMDYKEVSEWLEDDSKKIGINVNLSDLNLREEAKRSSAIYRGVMCLVAIRGALDFLTGNPPEYSKLHDHHIFPQNFIKKKLPEYRHLMNSVLNRTPLSEKTNEWIKGKNPSEYIRELEAKLGREKLMQILNTHFINEEAYEALESEDFEGFLRAREKCILEEIKERVRSL